MELSMMRRESTSTHLFVRHDGMGHVEIQVMEPYVGNRYISFEVQAAVALVECLVGDVSGTEVSGVGGRKYELRHKTGTVSDSSAEWWTLLAYEDGEWRQVVRLDRHEAKAVAWAARDAVVCALGRDCPG